MALQFDPILEWTPPGPEDIYHSSHPLHHLVLPEQEEMDEEYKKLDREILESSMRIAAREKALF